MLYALPHNLALDGRPEPPTISRLARSTGPALPGGAFLLESPHHVPCMERDDVKIWLVAESLVAQHQEEVLQIAYDAARQRAARGDDESYRVWLEVAQAAAVLLDT